MSRLVRIDHPNGVVTFQSALLTRLDVIHAFTTRVGGVSEGPFRSLNLAGRRSTGGEDSAAALDENRRRVVEALAGGDRANAEHTLTVACVNQVHGADIAIVDRSAIEQPSTDHAPTADALATAEPHIALTIRVADCVPILLACEHPGVVAAIHAGWRGLVAGVIPATIRRLAEVFDVDPVRCVAAIGPCIGVDAFEVREEVATELTRCDRHGDLACTILRAAHWPKPHVDLFAAARNQLEAAGIPRGAIDGEPMCTHANETLFFSHRRDDGRTGRMAAMIVRR